MKPLTLPVLLALVLVSAAAAPATAQSLVEVARLERLRREALARQAGPDAAPPKVYTDADLVHSGRLTVRIGTPRRTRRRSPGRPRRDRKPRPRRPPMPRPPATKNGGETA